MFRSLTCPTATMVLVTDVPMLAPMMIGMAGGTPRTVAMDRSVNGEQLGILFKGTSAFASGLSA